MRQTVEESVIDIKFILTLTRRMTADADALKKTVATEMLLVFSNEMAL